MGFRFFVFNLYSISLLFSHLFCYSNLNTRVERHSTITRRPLFTVNLHEFFLDEIWFSVENSSFSVDFLDLNVGTMRKLFEKSYSKISSQNSQSPPSYEHFPIVPSGFRMFSKLRHSTIASLSFSRKSTQFFFWFSVSQFVLNFGSFTLI